MSVIDEMTVEDKDVLVAVDNHGEGNASEFANMLPDLDTRAVHYRSEKLENMGLVTREKQGRSQMSPVVISVTALGEQVASELEYDHETVRDELQHLRDQHRQLIEGVSHLQDTYDELDEQVDEIDMCVEKNATDIQGVKRFLDDRFDVS
jgi:predicted MarR family transcription regulator